MALSVSGGSLEFAATIDSSNFAQTIARMEEQLRALTQTANTQASSLDNVAQKAALAITGYFSINAASDFLNQIVNVRGEFQKLEAVLTNSLGSNALAKGALGMIADYAAKTPFQLDEVANAYVKLVNQGFKPTKEELTSLGDLAASTGKSFDQVTEAILDAQTNQFERLKEFGIIANKQGDQVKFTFKGVETTVNDTSVAIRNYITGLGELQGVAGSTAAISGTLVGQISNLRDAFDKMLNELGQGSEGAISSAISGVSYLVEHYQNVIDIIKVLAATYGTYKAALIATTALQSGLTVKELLHYGALELVRKAQLLLNATMLANPYALAAAAIAAIITSIALFGKEATNVKSKIDLLAEAQSHVADNLAETQAKFTPYLEALKKTNLTEQDRLNIYEKIKAINPDILKGIDAKTLSYDKLKSNVDNYLGSLRKQIDLEANKEALIASVKQEKELDRQIQVAQKQAEEIAKLRNTATGNLAGVGLTGNTNAVSDNLNRLKADLKAQQDISKDLANGQIELEEKLNKGNDILKDKAGRTLAQIDADIKDARDKQLKESTNSAEYLKFQKTINDLEAERKKIAGESKSAIAAQKKEENDLNRILQDRKAILDDLVGLHRDATQSGLTKEASEVDKINEKYDLAIKKIQEFNAAHPKQQISSVEIQAVGSDRATEVNNALLKQQAEDYKKNLDVQKELFTQYEDAKKSIGIDKANQLFDEQRKGFTSYLDFLKNEQSRLLADTLVNGINVKTAEELKKLGTEIVATEKSNAQAAINETIRVIQATQTYADQRRAIEEKYQKDVAELQKNFTGEDLQKRVGIAAAERDEDLKNLKENLSQQSLLYKNLGEDIDTNFDNIGRQILNKTKVFLEDRKKLIEAALKQGYVIDIRTGDQIPLTKKQVDELNKALRETNQTIGAIKAEPFEQVAKYAGVAANSFSSLGSALKPINEDLADALSKMAEMAGVASNVASAFAGFEKGGTEGILSGITGAVSALSGVISFIGGQFSHNAQLRAEIDQFNGNILKGEIEINILYRERALIQAGLNKSRLEGIQAEIAVLEESLKKNQADVKTIFGALGKESYKSLQTFYELNTELSRKFAADFVSNGGTFEEALKRFGTAVQKIVDTPLAGKSFDDMEKLFLSGQLEGKAKDLFQELEKLKQEGIDINAALNADIEKSNELITGTTALSIADSIKDGFANGFKSVEQFAGKTKDIIRGAMLSALESKALEDPIKAIYAKFVEDSKSGGGLDQTEVASFTNSINKTITDAAAFAAQLEKATGIALSNATANADGSDTLQGAIKAASQQSIDLLSGQMGGVRLTNLEILDVANKQLLIQSKIEQNTAETVRTLNDYFRNWTTNGLAVKIG